MTNTTTTPIASISMSLDVKDIRDQAEIIATVCPDSKTLEVEDVKDQDGHIAPVCTIC